MYVGKGYVSNGMWKLNVKAIIKSNVNKASTSTYMLESSNIWYGQCLKCHVSSIYRVSVNLGTISSIDSRLIKKSKKIG